MTAERIVEPTSEHGHHWPMPPQDGYTVDDLFTLPDLPPHTEMIDGSLVFVSPQRLFRSIMIDLLVTGMRRTAPKDLKVRREMAVVLDDRNAPEPDISVVRADAVISPNQTRFQAADVLLAVEVVSPDSEARDRDTKPRKYAKAGIEHFWLADTTGANEQPVVYVHELDRMNKSYHVTGIHHDKLKVSVPYSIDIDITLEALQEL